MQVWTDIDQVLLGYGDYSWIRDTAASAAARLLLRPLMITFAAPSVLTPALKRHNRPGLNAWSPPCDEYANTFIPFQTGKHQFMAYISIARALSSVARVTASCTGTEKANAFVLGDALADSIELSLLARRYGGGTRRMLLFSNALIALFYLRVLILKRQRKFAASLQIVSLAYIFPLWFWRFTRQDDKLRTYSIATFLLLCFGVLPKMVLLMRNALINNDDGEGNHQVLDRRISLIVGGGVGVWLLARAHNLLVMRSQ